MNSDVSGICRVGFSSLYVFFFFFFFESTVPVRTNSAF